MKFNDVKERFSKTFHKSTDDAICALVNKFKGTGFVYDENRC
jgi:hypothetical protein